MDAQTLSALVEDNLGVDPGQFTYLELVALGDIVIEAEKIFYRISPQGTYDDNDATPWFPERIDTDYIDPTQYSKEDFSRLKELDSELIAIF